MVSKVDRAALAAAVLCDTNTVRVSYAVHGFADEQDARATARQIADILGGPTGITNGHGETSDYITLVSENVHFGFFYPKAVD